MLEHELPSEEHSMTPPTLLSRSPPSGRLSKPTEKPRLPGKAGINARGAVIVVTPSAEAVDPQGRPSRRWGSRGIEETEGTVISIVPGTVAVRPTSLTIAGGSPRAGMLDKASGVTQS